MKIRIGNIHSESQNFPESYFYKIMCLAGLQTYAQNTTTKSEGYEADVIIYGGTSVAVTAAMSASHIAFGSIRMEPVFMIMGQSAATAAFLSCQWMKR